MKNGHGFPIFGVRIFFLLFVAFPMLGNSAPVVVGDIEIHPEDFSSSREPEQRIAKCLACHGDHAGGDMDFGPDVHFGTPALWGMREDYLKASLVAYKTGARRHKEMSVIASMLDDETIAFMARAFVEYEAPRTRSAGELTALAAKDPLFLAGQTVAQQGIPEKGVPACLACHGPSGGGTAVGPRLAGQNAMYIESQFEAFASEARRTAQSAIMQPVVTGLTDDEVKAVAHYYESVIER